MATEAEMGQTTLDETTITEAVLAQLAQTPNPRLHHILTVLVRHLHDFAREVALTEDEWLQGIAFLTRVGQACSETRQEFILLSDTLGLSQLVVAQNHRRAPGATEQTIVGPFHVEGATLLPDGADIAADLPGDPLYVTLQVTDLTGHPLAGANIDVWHADAEGLYDLQDLAWTPETMKLRAAFRTDNQGRIRFRTIQPCAYPVPTDGPVGEMLRATHRQAMRPAHIHFRVSAPGYDTLTTHVFVADDAWLASDAVFGVRASCIANFDRHDAGEKEPGGSTAAAPFYTLDHTVRLQPV